MEAQEHERRRLVNAASNHPFIRDGQNIPRDGWVCAKWIIVIFWYEFELTIS